MSIQPASIASSHATASALADARASTAATASLLADARASTATASVLDEARATTATSSALADARATTATASVPADARATASLANARTATATASVPADARASTAATASVLADARASTAATASVVADARASTAATASLLADARASTATASVLADARATTATSSALADARATTATASVPSDARASTAATASLADARTATATASALADARAATAATSSALADARAGTATASVLADTRAPTATASAPADARNGAAGPARATASSADDTSADAAAAYAAVASRRRAHSPESEDDGGPARKKQKTRESAPSLPPQCPICFDDLAAADAAETPCGHGSQMHRDCLANHFAVSGGVCPVCREPVPVFNGQPVPSLSPSAVAARLEEDNAGLLLDEAAAALRSDGIALPFNLGATTVVDLNTLALAIDANRVPAARAAMANILRAAGADASRLESMVDIHLPPRFHLPPASLPLAPPANSPASRAPPPPMAPPPPPAAAAPAAVPAPAPPPPAAPTAPPPVTGRAAPPPNPPPSGANTDGTTATSLSDAIDTLVRDIALHPRLFRRIPAYGVPLWQEICRRALVGYATASRSGNADARSEALTALICLPGAALRCIRGGRQRGRRQLLDQLRVVLSSLDVDDITRLAGDERCDDDDATADGDEHAVDREPPPVAPPRDADAARIRRAVSLVRDGFISRAVRSLSQHGIAPATNDTLRQLQDLHPPPSDGIPVRPDGVPLVLVDKASLADRIRRLSGRGASPGPSGWTAEMLRPLVVDDVCMDALAVLTADIANGVLCDPLSKAILLFSRLVGIPKPRGGLRPIAVGELFPKLAGLHVLDQIGGALPALLGPVQKGVGVSGGCERGVHVLQAALELGGDDVVLGKTDIANAFNTVPRGRMLADCYAHPALAPAFRQLDWSYNEPSRLLVVERGAVHVIWSRQGTRQGDPLSQAAFAVSAARRYAVVVQRHPTVTAVAIHDDLTLAGPSADVISALDDYARETASDGHRLVAEKCSILWPHPEPPPPALAAACAQRRMQLTTGCAEVYGAPVGLDRDAITQWVADAAVRDERLFRDLEHREMPVQVSLLLLRVSAVPTMDYTIRTVPSDITRAAAHAFDERVLRTFQTRTGIAVSDVAKQQLHLPIRNGGIGLRCVATACAPAYASSLALAAQDIAPLLAATRANTTPPEHPTARGLSDALSCLRDEHVPDADKTAAGQSTCDPAAFWQLFRDGCAPHFQQELTRAIFTRHFNALFRDVSQSDQARLLSASSKRAGLWLTASPSSDELFIPDPAFLIALRLRLGLRPYDTMPSHCACGASLDDVSDANCAHTLTCQRQRARSGLLRHNFVLKRLLAWCRRGDVLYQENPMFDHAMPDAELYFSEKTHHVDVSITHPNALSYVKTASRARGSAAARREGNKENDHEYNAIQQGALFSSAVMETHGAFGKDLVALTATIVNHVNEAASAGDTAHQMLCGLRQELSVALQKGNAVVVQKTIAAARHASATGHVPVSRRLRDAANTARARAFVSQHAAPATASSAGNSVRDPVVIRGDDDDAPGDVVAAGGADAGDAAVHAAAANGAASAADASDDAARPADLASQPAGDADHQTSAQAGRRSVFLRLSGKGTYTSRGDKGATARGMAANAGGGTDDDDVSAAGSGPTQRLPTSLGQGHLHVSGRQGRRGAGMAADAGGGTDDDDVSAAGGAGDASGGGDTSCDGDGDYDPAASDSSECF